MSVLNTACPEQLFYVGAILLRPGVEVLVDASPYGGGSRVWCEVTAISPGTASVYPVKAAVPGLGVGQWKPGEVLAARVGERMRRGIEAGVVFHEPPA